MKPDHVKRIKALAGPDTVIVHAVGLRLESSDQQDVDRIAGQLLEQFGEAIRLTESRQLEGGRIWVVYGTFI